MTMLLTKNEKRTGKNIDKRCRSAQNVNKMDEKYIDRFAKILSSRIEKDVLARKYAPAKVVLKLVGAGAFLAASIAVPNLPLALKPFLRREDPHQSWKRFNIPYLRRTLERLEKQRLVEIVDDHGTQVVRITKIGQKKILTQALDTLSPRKPKTWNHQFTLVSFDLPEHLAGKRKQLASYLKAWNFYPLQKSVYLHAYPCREELDLLGEYLAIPQYILVCTVTQINHQQTYKEFFDLS